MSVYGYLRVSTLGQLDSGLGLDAQSDAVGTYARANTLALTRTYRDCCSGSVDLDKRTQGSQLCAVLGPGDHVVFPRLDRGFRSQADLARRLDVWRGQGVTVHLCDLGIAVYPEGSASGAGLRGAMGQFFVSVLGAFAQLERAMISERTRVAQRAAKRRGEVAGHLPLGWVNEGGQRAPCAPERVLLGYLFAAREQTPPVSYISLANSLTRQGWTNRKGRALDPRTLNRTYRRLTQLILEGDADTAAFVEDCRQRHHEHIHRHRPKCQKSDSGG